MKKYRRQKIYVWLLYVIIVMIVQCRTQVRREMILFLLFRLSDELCDKTVRPATDTAKATTLELNLLSLDTVDHVQYIPGTNGV